MFPLPIPGAVYLVDLSSLTRGLYHVLPPAQNDAGEPIAVTAAVSLWLVNLLLDHKPAYLAFAADGATTPRDGETSEQTRMRRYRRTALWPDYKAGREPPGPEYDLQIDRLVEVLLAHRIPVFRGEGYEADDYIGAVVPKLADLGVPVVVVSKDHDLWQLVRNTKPAEVRVWDGSPKTFAIEVEDVVERYGVGPGWLPALFALAGDKDEAPGLPRVSDQRAKELLLRHTARAAPDLDAAGALECVLAKWQWETNARGIPNAVGCALRDHADDARLGLKLTADVPVALDLSEMRVGWEESDAARVRAIGDEINVAVLRKCRRMEKPPMDEQLLARWFELEAGKG